MRIQLLARAVLVPADVGDENRIVRRGLRNLIEQARRVNRLAGVALGRRELRRSSSARRFAVVSTRRLRLIGASALKPRSASTSCAQRRLGVADDADLDRIDLADLLRIDVDLNQRVGGMANVCSGFHELQSASPNAVPTARMTSAPRIVSLATRVPQMPVMPQASG